jgi:hypothetical protein
LARAVERIGDVVQAVQGTDGKMTTKTPEPRAPIALAKFLADLRSYAAVLRPIGQPRLAPKVVKPLAPNRGDR